MAAEGGGPAGWRVDQGTTKRPRLLLVLLTLACHLLPFDADDDVVVEVPTDDVEMNAAIARAQATLPDFWTALESADPELSGLALKVRVTEGDATEHLWCVNVRRDGDVVHATVNNEPESAVEVAQGPRWAPSTGPQLRVPPRASEWAGTQKSQASRPRFAPQGQASPGVYSTVTVAPAAGSEPRRTALSAAA